MARLARRSGVSRFALWVIRGEIEGVSARLQAALRPSLRRAVRDLRARINDVVGSGWWSMTLGMIGFFAAYYVLFVLIMRETGVSMPHVSVIKPATRMTITH